MGKVMIDDVLLVKVLHRIVDILVVKHDLPKKLVLDLREQINQLKASEKSEG